MKLSTVTFTLAALACGGGGGGGGDNAGDPSGPPPPPATYSVQGIVQDSIANSPLASVAVSLSGATASTDFLGAYQFSGVSAGAKTLSVNTPGFEAYSKILTVAGNTLQNVPLRRLKPYMKDFAGSSTSSVVASTFQDLQGSGTLDIAQSSVTVSGPGYTNLQLLGSATVTDVDAISRRVSVNTGKTNIQTAKWTVRDNGGNFTQFQCTIGGSCTEF